MTFKRFQVLDLLFGDVNHNVKGEWVKTNDRIPEAKQNIYPVKLENGDHILAYWCADKMMNMGKYYKGYKPTPWWSKNDKEPLHDVVEWLDYDRHESGMQP